MSDFIKEWVMDERERAASDYADAAENKHSCNQYLTGCCFSETAIEVAFMKGWDEANARAEKRIREFEDQLAISDCDDLSECVAGCRYFSYRESVHHKNCGIYEQSLTKINADKLQSLEQRCKGLVEALVWCDEMLTARDEMNSKVHCAPVRLSPITERVQQALKAYSEGEK